jgi:simple sugar transport system permease protein
MSAESRGLEPDSTAAAGEASWAAIFSSPAARAILSPILALVAAFAAGAVVIAAAGDDPLAVYGLLLGSAFSWPDGIGYTLFYATPLIFTGLAVAVAFRAGLFNVGAEGQLYAAAFAAAWVGIAGAGLSAWLLAPLACLAAVAAGGAWGALPGVLKVRFGAHEVISTIMLNFIAIGLAGYLTQYHYKPAGDPILETLPVGAGAHVARLGRLVPGLPERIPLNLAFPAALAACAAVYLLLWRTRWGYELRATGANREAAAYAGIHAGRQVVLAMAISGALAGMVAINEVLGYRYRYYDGFSAGYGFTGIAVALLGRNHPAGVVIAALFFGALVRGGLFVGIFSDHVSRDLVLVLEGLVILCVAALRLPRGRSGAGPGARSQAGSKAGPGAAA